MRHGLPRRVSFRPFASFPLALALLLLGAGCATGPKFAAMPPPAELSGEPAPAADAPPRYYQPLATDDDSPRRGKGMGVLFAQYPFMNEAKSVTVKFITLPNVKASLEPLRGTLPAIYANKEIGFYGLAYGDMPIKLGALEFPTKVVGLYEGVRVPITLVDFKKADVQLFIVPGLTLQVLMSLSAKDSNHPGWSSDLGMIAGGSLNGAGLGLSVGGWLMLEADFVKVGWTYFMLNLTEPSAKKEMGTISFSAWSYGFAPVFYARAMF